MIRIHVYPVDTYFEGIGYNDSLERAIREQTFFLVPGHERDPRFIYGQWDGKEHMFQPTTLNTGARGHVAPTGLLQRIVAVISSRKQAYDIISYVPQWTRDPNIAYLDNATLVTRDYQTSATMALITAQPIDVQKALSWAAHYGDQPMPPGWARNPRLGGVLQAGTGAGKTATAANTIRLLQSKTVFLVNQKDLMRQTIEEFTRFLGCEIGQCGGGKVDIKDITIATVQTVNRAFGADTSERGEEKDETPANEVTKAAIRQMMWDAKVVYMDECHGVAARQAYTSVRQAVNAFFVGGLSASPWRDDGLDLLIEAACGPVVYKITATDLIARGFLVPPEITFHHMPNPEHVTMDHYSDKFDKLYKSWVVEDAPRNAYIADLAMNHMLDGEVVIVLVKQIAHGELLQRMIPYSTFLQGKLSNKTRKTIIDQTKNGEIRCLIATSLADQGLDLPVASVLILAGGGKSSTKALQRIGRVLRPYPGKTMAWIHDIVDQSGILKKHYYERKHIYKQEALFKLIEKNVVFTEAIRNAKLPVSA